MNAQKKSGCFRGLIQKPPTEVRHDSGGTGMSFVESSGFVSESMLRVLELIAEGGVYAYSPDRFFADDLPLVAILDDDDRTVLPVRAVRGLLARGLVQEAWDGEFPALEMSSAGLALLGERSTSEVES